MPLPGIAIGIGAAIGGFLLGGLKWLANFFTKKAVAMALVAGVVASLTVIPVTLWAYLESQGIDFGVLTQTPFANAPAPIPYILYCIDLFIPIQFLFTVMVVSVVFRFISLNAMGIVAAAAKVIFSRL